MLGATVFVALVGFGVFFMFGIFVFMMKMWGAEILDTNKQRRKRQYAIREALTAAGIPKPEGPFGKKK